jgi:hypothetical protein
MKLKKEGEESKYQRLWEEKNIKKSANRIDLRSISKRER